MNKYCLNQIKREPLKLARIEKIKKSRDDAQRVVVVTYNNISLNKKGEWIGTPVTVERCLNDLGLVDDALDESILDLKLQNKNIRTNADDQASGNNKIITSETQEIQGISDEKKKTETSKADVKVEKITKDEKDENNDGQSKEKMIMDNLEDDYTVIEEKGIENEPIIEVRRSQRKRNNRMLIQPDQIDDCDGTKDIDYK